MKSISFISKVDVFNIRILLGSTLKDMAISEVIDDDKILNIEVNGN